MPPDDATAGSQGTEAQPQGQGESTADAKGSEGGFNWGLFPDVPEEQRPLLEPHLKKVQGHVTKLEQEHAPFKDLQSEQVQGLVQFEQAFNQDPMGVWLEMGKQLAASDMLGELDIDAVASIAAGEDVGDDEGEEVEGGEEGDDQYTMLAAEIEEMKRQQQQAEQQRRQTIEQQLLARQIAKMQDQLKEAGAENVPEQLLVASIISNNGNIDEAVGQLTGFRDSTLKGFAANNKKGGKDLEMPKGSPKAPEKREPRDSFDAATQAARSFLSTRNEATAQGE